MDFSSNPVRIKESDQWLFDKDNEKWTAFREQEIPPSCTLEMTPKNHKTLLLRMKEKLMWLAFPSTYFVNENEDFCAATDVVHWYIAYLAGNLNNDLSQEKRQSSRETLFLNRRLTKLHFIHLFPRVSTIKFGERMLKTKCGEYETNSTLGLVHPSTKYSSRGVKKALTAHISSVSSLRTQIFYLVLFCCLARRLLSLMSLVFQLQFLTRAGDSLVVSWTWISTKTDQGSTMYHLWWGYWRCFSPTPSTTPLRTVIVRIDTKWSLILYQHTRRLWNC